MATLATASGPGKELVVKGREGSRSKWLLHVTLASVQGGELLPSMAEVSP
jgi:hypothetical protein